jgi:hypothetical protein
MPVMNETAARCQTWVRSVIDRKATVAMPATSTAATTSRIDFCGTRSATTPPSNAGSSTPTALAVETNESCPGPPPIRMTSQTRPTTQTPDANVLSTRATASLR